MESEGLVGRFPDPKDGRSVIITLTERGAEIGGTPDRESSKDNGIFKEDLVIRRGCDLLTNARRF